MLRFMLVAVVALASPFSAVAQDVPDRGGVVEAGLLIRQLEGVKRVLMIGAHPDDEDTSLLALLARGMGAQTAYLSITRGDGGQNLIGPELGEGLGVIRTGELEAARALDGGSQFFARAFDYGYSKSADEAFAHWPREQVVRDAVWIIRNFRPQVIVSVWSGTPRDGHGQHQASGIIATEAFEAAADAERFTDLPGLGSVPWTTSKLFYSARGFGRRVEAPIPVQVGGFDPLLGRSHRQLAMASRSQHRSQDMGAPQPLGPGTTGLRLGASRAPESMDEGLFGGIDTTVVSLADGVEGSAGARLRELLEAHVARITDAREMLDVLRPERAAAPLAHALRLVRSAHAHALESLGADEVAVAELERRTELTQRALLTSSSVVFDVRTSDDLVVAGEDVELDVRLWNGGPFEITGASVDVHGPLAAGARIAAESQGGDAIRPGAMTRWSFEVPIDPGAQTDDPYFLRRPREGEMYRWPEEEPEVWGASRNPARFGASARFTIDVLDGSGPTEVVVEQSARFFGVDKARGEFEKPVLIAPAVSVDLQPAVMAWPLDHREHKTVTVVLQNEANEGSAGDLRLDLPRGWSADPASYRYDLREPSSSRGFTFDVTPGSEVGEGAHRIRAIATDADGRRFDRRVDVIDYPHIERTLMLTPAETRVSMFPVRVAEGIRVGYIMGSGDDGLGALRQMGVEVEELTEEQIADGAFDGYDVLVLGIRVYETRPDVAAVNDRILDFARSGGTVIVQYNKYEYPAGGFAPDTISMGGRPIDRVTDEASPVRFVDPSSPVLNVPNRITESDFDGWVQERGLYFLKEWGDSFTPVLELTDPGEDAKLGSLVVAPVGEGMYAYVALSFFRQFPAGVPGAYRLFANLVSLRADDWTSWGGGR